MNNKARIAQLEALLARLRADKFRTSRHECREVSGQIAGSLADLGLHDAAMQAADILSRDGFSSSMYHSMRARLEMLVNSALVRLRSNETSAERPTRSSGSKVFIGHGRSPAWLELKNFIADRLKLEWEEFNRVPTAGKSVTRRLEEMIDAACFALIVMTAEDESKDAKFHPRLNVVHEAGLFQGRLGFERAIILLEEGCEEFSNIHGLGQIRFPRGNIKACFEDIRGVLEREEVIRVP